MGEKEPNIQRPETAIERVLEQQIEFAGFTQEQREWLSNLLASLGLPLTRVRRFVYEQELPHPDVTTNSIYGFNHSRLAEYTYADQTIRLSRGVLENIARRSRGFALRAVLAHEIAHSFTIAGAVQEYRDTEAGKAVPESRRGFLAQYKSREQMMQLGKDIAIITIQLLNTKLYLNTYHRGLSKRYEEIKEGNKKGTIPDTDLLSARFDMVSEVHALLVELFYKDPQRLIQLDDACRTAYARLPSKERTTGYVSIVEASSSSITAVTGGTKAEAEETARQSWKVAQHSPF